MNEIEIEIIVKENYVKTQIPYKDSVTHWYYRTVEGSAFTCGSIYGSLACIPVSTKCYLTIYVGCDDSKNNEKCEDYTERIFLKKLEYKNKINMIKNKKFHSKRLYFKTHG